MNNIKDIVLDANVLGHSGNPSSRFFPTSLALLEVLDTMPTKLALDDTGKNAPAADTSHMYMEYLSCISPTSIAAVLLAAWARRDRLVFHARPDRETWKRCMDLVPKNKGDQIVLAVAVSSQERLVVSNDYKDFSTEVRRQIRKAVGVIVLASDASELCALTKRV